jgi:hypothetical protein
MPPVQVPVRMSKRAMSKPELGPPVQVQLCARVPTAQTPRPLRQRADYPAAPTTDSRVPQRVA